MRLLNSFRDLKIGQKVAWKSNLTLGSKWKGILPADEPGWICICQVKGFYKQTTYPLRRDSSQYTTTERVVFGVLTRNRGDIASNAFLLDIHKDEIDSAYSYDVSLWNVYLLENEKDYIEVLKNILADSI